MAVNKKIAVIGTGGSATSLLESIAQPVDIDFFNSAGEGEFEGQAVAAIGELDTALYDEIYLAVYDYGQIINQLKQTDGVIYYWFNNLEKKIYRLDDLYNDTEERFIPSDKVLTVLYDFRISPPTYDFLIFLVRCKLEALRRGAETMEIILCPGDKFGFRENIDFFSLDEMNFRLVNLLLPLVKLVDNAASVVVARSRREARIHFRSAPNRFPDEHNFVKPVARHFYYELFEFVDDSFSHMILKSNAFYRNKVHEWAKARGLDVTRSVVITLRENQAHLARNSNLKEWQNIADNLVKQGFRVIVLRDTETALQPLHWEGVELFSEASFNVNLRLGLYELCRFNVAVSNGAQSLLSLSKACRYVLFGMNNVSCTSNTEAHLEKIGMMQGEEQRFGAFEGQYLCWDPVNKQNVLNAIMRLIKENKL